MNSRKSKLIATICAVSVIAACVLAAIIMRINNFRVEFEVTGETAETVEYGSDYALPEVKAYLKGNLFCKQGKELDVTRSGEVDTGKLGTYTVSWTASSTFKSGDKTEVIRVVDTTAPVITLTPYEKSYLYVGETYTEPGFTAADAVDGDLTASVTATAIDTSSQGQKEVVYTVTDSSGNTATVKRTVVVRANAKPAVIDSPKSTTGGGVIYLTFDDGPGAYTAKLLDILAKYNVKATFFVTGGGDRSLIAREAKEGHSVAIHTMSHDYKNIYASEEAFFKDLNAVNEIIKQQTGEYSKLMRFPGGSSNTVSRKYCKGIMTRLTAAVEEKGFKYFDWNVSSGDAGGTTSADKVYTNVINGVRGKAYSIVLQHDIKGFSVNAVERIIVWGLNNGYTFEPLTYDSPTVHQHVNN